MPHPGIDGVAVVDPCLLHRRRDVGEPTINARVVLGVHPQPLRPDARDVGKARRRTVAHHERPQRRAVRRVPEALASAPAEADRPDAVPAPGLERLQVGDGRVEIERDRIGIETRDELARLVAGSRRAAAARQEVRRQRDEPVLRELLGRLADPVRQAEDLVDHDDARRAILAFGIREIPREGGAAGGGELHVFRVNVGGGRRR